MAPLGLAPAGLTETLVAPAKAETGGHFLTADELRTLESLCDRLVPGPPEDLDPGSLEARIDLIPAVRRPRERTTMTDG